jgi:hypothetical protein
MSNIEKCTGLTWIAGDNVVQLVVTNRSLGSGEGSYFAKRNIFTGKVAWNSYLTNGLRQGYLTRLKIAIKILPIHGCISINRQLTSSTENYFAGKRSMECKQDLVRNKIKHEKTYKIGKLVRKRIKHRQEGHQLNWPPRKI